MKSQSENRYFCWIHWSKMTQMLFFNTDVQCQSFIKLYFLSGVSKSNFFSVAVMLTFVMLIFELLSNLSSTVCLQRDNCVRQAAVPLQTDCCETNSICFSRMLQVLQRSLPEVTVGSRGLRRGKNKLKTWSRKLKNS